MGPREDADGGSEIGAAAVASFLEARFD
jgi:hypothetical protein